MTAPAPSPTGRTELGALIERLEHVLDLLRCAVFSDDRLTACYAAAAITELSDQVEVALLAAHWIMRPRTAPASTPIGGS